MESLSGVNTVNIDGKILAGSGKIPIKPPNKFKIFLRGLNELKIDFVHKIDHLFGIYGDICFRYPYYVILFAMCLFFFGCGGFLTSPVWIDGSEELYSLPVSQARNDGIRMNSIFGRYSQRATYIGITGLTGKENLLQWDTLDVVKSIDAKIQGKILDNYSGTLIAVDPAEVRIMDPEFNDNVFISDECDPSRIDYSCLCTRLIDSAPCDVQSVLSMGVLDTAIAKTRDGPPEIYVIDGLVYSSRGQGYIPGLTLGGYTKVKCSRLFPRALLHQIRPDTVKSFGSPQTLADVECITSVEAFTLIYLLRDVPELYQANMLWEEMIVQRFLAISPYYLRDDNVRVTFNPMRARDDELRKSTSESSDLLFVFFTFAILVIYSVAFNFNINIFKSKVYTAMAGIGSAILGMVAGIGFICYFGVEVVPTALIVPFLCMGIGVDDMFVILNAYSLTYPIVSPRERVIRTMQDSGLSITITTLTNLIAFGIGSFSQYLSIKNFCLFSAGALGFGFIFASTLTVAVLSLEAYREAQMLTCCCFPIKELAEYERHLADEETPLCKDEDPGDVVSRRVRIVFILDPYWNSKLELKEPEDSVDWSSSAAMSTTTLVRRRKNTEPKTSRPDSRLVSPQFFKDITHYGRPQLSDGGIAHSARETKTALSPTSSVVYRQDRWHDLKSVVLEEPKGNVGRWLRDFFLKKYGTWLLRPYVKILVMVLFAILTCFGGYGVFHVEMGLDLKDLSPDTSFLKEYDTMQQTYFIEYDVPTSLFFQSDIPWHLPEYQDSLNVFLGDIAELESTRLVLNPFNQILSDPAYFTKLNRHDEEYLSSTLMSAVQGKYVQYNKDIIFEGSKLKTWRATIFPKMMVTSEERATFMLSLRAILNKWSIDPYELHDGFLAKTDNRDIIADTASLVPLTAYGWNYMMIFYESDLGIVSAVMVSMGVAVVAMLFVTVLLITQMRMGLLVVLMLFLIDLNLFGFMYYWTVKLNMISMINLVISVGFAVDYAAHMCHTFTHCRGEKAELRVVECLVLMGAAVFNGATSTLLGILMLGFSTSYIFRVFFKLFLLVVVFGVGHGMILLPVLLTYMNPSLE